MSIVEELCRAAAGIKYDVQKLSTEDKGPCAANGSQKTDRKAGGDSRGQQDRYRSGQSFGDA